LKGKREPESVANKWHDMTSKTFECMRMDRVTGGAGDADETTRKSLAPSALQKWKKTKMWEILSEL
jgi:hypothetical protein